MAVRWRVTGEIVCAAKSDPMEGDTYIDDRLLYELAQHQKVLIPSQDHFNDNLWFWLHGECEISDHPQDCRDAPIIVAKII